MLTLSTYILHFSLLLLNRELDASVKTYKLIVRFKHAEENTNYFKF